MEVDMNNDEDNVVQLPSRLERLAKRLEDTYTREAKNKEEWVSLHMERGAVLLEAKENFSYNPDFSKWLETNGFGPNRLNAMDRTAYIAMAKEPERMREVLEKTESKSIQLIYRNSWEPLIRANKRVENPQSAPKPKPQSKPQLQPQRPRKTVEEKAEEVEARIRLARAKDEEERVKEEARRHREEARTRLMQEEARGEKARAEAAFLRHGSSPEALEKILKDLERIRGYTLGPPPSEEEIRTGKGFTRKERLLIVKCLHPDQRKNATETDYDEAIKVFNANVPEV